MPRGMTRLPARLNRMPKVKERVLAGDLSTFSESIT